jgi:hypothetical protein
MTLAKRTSRTILVDGTTYRWKAGRSERGVHSEAPVLTLTAHVDKVPSDSTLDLRCWESHCDVFTPDVVATLIRNAKRLGWDTESKGTFRVEPSLALKMFNDDPDAMRKVRALFREFPGVYGR